MKKSLLFLVLILMFTSVSVLAVEGVDKVQPQERTNERNIFERESTLSRDGSFDVGLPDKTMEDAEGWIDRKGNDVISFLQTGSQSYLIIIFIIGALLAATGGKRMRPSGFLMMILAIVSQGVIMYAPELMDFFQNWIAS